MPIPATVDAAAEMLQVTPKTVYKWIREEGLPVCDHKARPVMVDTAQIMAWIDRRKGQKPHPWTQGGRNLFRAICLEQLKSCTNVLANVLLSVRDGEVPKLKLTDDQIFKLYTLLAMAQAHYVVRGAFESDIAQHFGCGNLDDIASLVFRAVVKSRWPDGADDVPLPPAMKALMSKEMRDMFTKA